MTTPKSTKRSVKAKKMASGPVELWELHQVFFDRTGIEISVGIHFALKNILDLVREREIITPTKGKES